jgi:hypothetical protein
MSYDNWLQEPYTSAALRDAQWERNAERIYKSYNRKELFPEFLITYGEEIKDDNPILAAVAQRDYEAIGGLLLEAFEVHLSKLAEYDADRLQG